MSIETLKEQLPEYAKDLKLNLGNVLSAPNLTPQQAWGTAVASAYAAGNTTVLKAIIIDANTHLKPEALRGAKAAAAIMGMNNIYYRFTHLVSNTEYRSLPANLRMSIIGNPNVEKIDFELWSLAVSAINGCGMCIDSHEQILAKGGITKDVIQNVIRIASVVNAVAGVFTAEEALQ